MEVREGAVVVTADGHRLGHVDRVVIDPGSKEITDVVVRQGLFFGEDKVVPIEMVANATAGEVRLRNQLGDLSQLQRFEEIHFVPPETNAQTRYSSGAVRPLYRYPPVSGKWVDYYTGRSASHPPQFTKEITRNIPQNTVGLAERSPVISADGQRVGLIERIFTLEQPPLVTHILISAGWLFPHKKLIPMEWVNSIRENEIQLKVNAEVLGRVPEFQEGSATA